MAAQVVAAACASPRLVEEEGDDESCSSPIAREDNRRNTPCPMDGPPVGVVRPVALKAQARPSLPLKVAKPIPQRATEQFYDETYKQGIPAYAVNEAIMESHDWHRKWTQQDEQGHTMPHDHLLRQQQHHQHIHGDTVRMGALPQQYAFQNPDFHLERMAGARNPSPEWMEGDESSVSSCAEQRKRGRMDHYSAQPLQGEPMMSATYAPPLMQIFQQQQSPPLRAVSQMDNKNGDEEDADEASASGDYLVAPAAKRPVPIRPAAPALDTDEDDSDYVSPLQQQHLNARSLVRPVALRAPRPVIARLPSSSASSSNAMMGSIPKYIHSLEESDENSCSTKMSVITQGTGLSQCSRDSNRGGGDASFDFYHTDAPRSPQVHVIDDDSDEPSSLGRSVHTSLEESLVDRRDALLQGLAISGGDAQADAFTTTIEPLARVFEERDLDTRAVVTDNDCQEHEDTVQGTWLTLTKPTFFGNLGENDAGDPMYTLGRMTFDMFSPTNLVCSLQGNFNSIEVVGDEQRNEMLKAGLVPKGLRTEVENRDVVLRTYNVITAFTIESSLAAYPEAPNKDVRRPIRGIMTTFGYTLPDPEVPNRHSIWITGGRIEANNNPADQAEWKRLFSLHPPKHGLGEQAKLLAVKLLMGATIPDSMNEDGSMDYSFTRPLGGHGVAYVDVLYLDNSLRVVRGHRGTFFVFSRLQQE